MEEDVKEDRKLGILASNDYFDKFPEIKMPEQIGDKIVTLNKQGFMRVELDPYTLEWISDCTVSSLPFLELGSAYGQASIAAVKQGGTVIANDISIEHLTILRSRVDAQYRERLYLNHAEFPNKTNFLSNSLGGVLFCRLGHFFTNAQMQIGFRKIFDWLAPGGKLYFIAISPYHYTIIEDILPEFLRKKASHDPNPGYIIDMRKYIAKSQEHVPKFMNCFDEETITSLAQDAHFTIEKVSLFDYSSKNSKNKGFVGLIAIKK